MKRPLSFSITITISFAALFLFSCGAPKEETLEDTSAAAAPISVIPAETPKPAICLWKEVAIRETPSEKGKYATSIYLGENLTALADTASDITKGRKVIYRKVTLTDGSQGWVREDFIAIDGKAAAFLRDAALYKRPDIMTTSGKNFARMDFVAITKTSEDGWSEVIGKRVGDSWFSSGWVKSEHLTQRPVDVAFSVFYAKAMELSDEAKRVEEISKLIDNNDLSTSIFRTALTPQDASDELTAPEITAVQ